MALKNMKTQLGSIFILTLLLACQLEVKAQDALKPRVSPLDMVTYKQENTYIKVVYSRPHKNDRNVFGGLVPFGKVWRTGANEATEITTTGEIEIGGKKLQPGTYTLFSIPNEKNWTIIINRELGQWGSYKYQEDLDVLRFDVKSEKIDQVYEPFTINFEQNEKVVYLNMIWDQTKVVIPIKVTGK